MAKCSLCGKETNAEARETDVVICGLCSLQNGIMDTDDETLAREQEELPYKSCNSCRRLLKIDNGKVVYFCQRFDVPLSKSDIIKNYCECYERLRK